MKKNIIKKESGYTMIETMIAVSLFIIIVMMGMGALLNANALHQKSQNMRSIIDNLSFTMEDMSRNLRTGYNYYCLVAGDPINSNTVSITKSCDTGGGGIVFEQQNGTPPSAPPANSNTTDQWVYYINNGKIFKSTDGLTTTPIQLTPDEVNINSASFIVKGAEPSPDTLQPFVTIKLVGTITIPGKNIVTPFSLQTSVSQRQTDR